jgi:ubiquinone/menaquinone biosynthesis C-methylase UbiE
MTTTEHSTDSVPGLAQAKQFARASWAAGDFATIARLYLWPVGEEVVRRVGVGRDEAVLDVGCGTGNASIRAALAGGRVTGVDLTPELFDDARREAATAGVDVAWVEGDAEDLPFPDASFDVVLSTFGVMFAPRHRVAARELVRVLKPGGRFAITSWTPEGRTGQQFRMMGEYAPPPPPFAEPPLAWGVEQHVRELFDDSDVVLEFSKLNVPLPDLGTADEAYDYLIDKWGPLIVMRPMLEAQGLWDEVLERSKESYAPGADAEYLLVTGRRAG